MEALIQIAADAQGVSTVSGRELHRFMEIRSDFHKWFVRRVDKYGLVEGQDFVRVTQKRDTLGGEQETVDYALTLDCAKELAMVQNNERGKAARQYFIDCEKQLRQVAQVQQPAALSPTEQLMLQLVQQNQAMLHNQQLMLDQLRQDMTSLQRTQPAPPLRKPRTQPAPPPAGPPRSFSPSIRQAINTRVNEYCAQVGCAQQEAFRYLYNRMQQVYGVNVWNLARTAGETLLEAVERYGQLDRLYSLVMAELAYTD